MFAFKSKMSHPLDYYELDDPEDSFDVINPTSVPQMFLKEEESDLAPMVNKYLYPKSDKVEELRPEQVRWFFKGSDDKKWIPFIGYDSLRIECKYREIEKAGVNIDPKSQRERLCVRGSLYEVDVYEKKCYPIYWDTEDETGIIMRGIWFTDYTWQPLESEFAIEIEKLHLQEFINKKIVTSDDQPVKLPFSKVVMQKDFKDFYVEWNAANKVFLYYKSLNSKIKRTFGSKFGISQGGTALQRGYNYEACMEDKLPEIGHLVFVVHGIGQKMDMGSIVQRCRELRETAEKMSDKHLTVNLDLDKRAEFLPVEWRSVLKLDGDMVESITPAHFLKLRSLLNASAMDILYYTSPLYRAEIIQGLQSQLNRLYMMFCEKTPYFESGGGKVSIIAHSLGSVIVYDILTGWNPIQLYDQYASSMINSSSYTQLSDSSQRPFPINPDIDVMERKLDMHNEKEKCQKLGGKGEELLQKLRGARAQVHDLENEMFELAAKHCNKTPNLIFKIENLFTVGSPLAVFLALRGIRPQGTGTLEDILPKTLCKRLFNIYHPYDPIAYRMEPLVLKHYTTIMPLKIYPEGNTFTMVSYESLPAIAYSDRHHSKTKVAYEKKSSADKKNTSEKNNNEDLPESSEASSSTGSTGVSSNSSSSWSSWFNRSAKDITLKVNSELRVMSLKEMEPSVSSLAESVSSDKSAEQSGEDDICNYLMDPTNPDVKIYMKNPRNEPTELLTELEYRLDYTLHKGKMASAYWGALTSHTSYWTNPDVALFLLHQLHPDKFQFAHQRPKAKEITKK